MKYYYYHQTFNMRRLLTILFVSMSFISHSQQSPYDDLIKKIQDQEINFPFPQKDTVITVGEININNNKPIIKYFIPSQVRHVVYEGSKESSKDWGLPGPDRTIYIEPLNYNEIKGAINANTHLRFKLRFTIINWIGSANSLTVSVGSQTNTVTNGASEILFNNILEPNASIACYTNQPVFSKPNPLATVTGDKYLLDIDWNVAGAGIVTLPVLPVKLIYVPVIDFKQANTSSISTSNSQGYNLSFSTGSVNGSTTALPTSLTNIDQLLNDMNNTSKVMEAYPDPDIQAIGKAMGMVSGILTAGLGTSTISQTISNSVTNQHTFSVVTSETEKMVAKSSNGGPGEGDVICFYTDVKLLWCEINGKMQLAILGYNPTLKTPTMLQLSQALNTLVGKPKGTKDPIWLLDEKTIQSLLTLDPFTGPNGAKTQLNPSRFTLAHKLDGTSASFQNGGTDETETVMHQVMQTDAQSEINTITKIETDKPGFLSFLGLGETDDKTVQSNFSKSSSSQLSTGQSIIDEFTLHGDGNKDHYHCEVYFDNVFGTFAFRDNSDDLNVNNRVEGFVVNSSGEKVSNARVLIMADDKSFWTTSDTRGSFKFTLPGNIERKSMTINSGSSKIILNK